MASVQRDRATGSVVVQFVGIDKRRRKMRIKHMDAKSAAVLGVRIEQLITAAKFGSSLETDVTAWVAKLSDDVAAKLTDFGLLKKREAATLGAFIEAYTTSRTDLKPRTHKMLKQGADDLLAFFGAEQPLREITRGDADEFRLKLLEAKPQKPTNRKGVMDGRGLAESTAGRRCSVASQFFRAAVRKDIITKNPFEGVGSAAKGNDKRMVFVSRDVAQRVLDACPDAESRLLFALARYGGIRVPSELDGLLWSEVDWARSRFLVHSPKTERHHGGASRWVPIFPELRPYLEDAREVAAADETHLIRRHRGIDNHRDRFRTIIKRAGEKAWGKLFQNLRSTRETELARMYPTHLVCAWIGNSEVVAREHYLQITDDDFEAAATGKSTVSFLAHSALDKVEQH